MEAIVLVGGQGKRLRSVVPDLPKPMAPVNGRPFLTFVLDQLAEASFQTVILAAGYRHEMIRSHFGECYRDLQLRYSAEDQPLGTGGAIRHALTQTSGRDVLVLNGDTFLDIDHRALVEAHLNAGANLSVVVCWVSDVGRYGALELSGNTVTGVRDSGTVGSGWINGGVYVVNSELQERFPVSKSFSFERDFLASEVAAIKPLAYTAETFFLDIGVPDDYARAQKWLPLCP